MHDCASKAGSLQYLGIQCFMVIKAGSIVSEMSRLANISCNSQTELPWVYYYFNMAFSVTTRFLRNYGNDTFKAGHFIRYTGL